MVCLSARCFRGIAALLIFLGSPPVFAEVKVCNLAGEPVQLALQYQVGGEPRTKGWFKLDVKGCRTFSELGDGEVFRIASKPDVRYVGAANRSFVTVCVPDSADFSLARGLSKVTSSCPNSDLLKFTLADFKTVPNDRDRRIFLHPLQSDSADQGERSESTRRADPSPQPSPLPAPTPSPRGEREGAGASTGRPLARPIPYPPDSQEYEREQRKQAELARQRKEQAERDRAQREAEASRRKTAADGVAVLGAQARENARRDYATHCGNLMRACGGGCYRPVEESCNEHKYVCGFTQKFCSNSKKCVSKTESC